MTGAASPPLRTYPKDKRMELEQAIPAPVAPLEAPSEPGPIDAKSVVSKPPVERPAPDSSILANRLEQMLERRQGAQQTQSLQTEYERVQEENRILRAMARGETPPPRSQDTEAVSPELKAMRDKLAEMEKSQQSLQSRLSEQQQQQELAEAAKEMSAWVSAQAEAFPVINGLGYQDLVFQKVWNTKQQTGRIISEAQATREIELELEDIVHKAAPLMGYQKSEQRAASDGQNNEPISLTTGEFSISQPVDRDKMTDDEWQEYLIRQYTG